MNFPHLDPLLLNWSSAPRTGSLASSLAGFLRREIAAGQLAPGDRLPPSRWLATELQLARGTVTTALEMLAAEGLLVSRVGSGVFIADEAQSLSASGAVAMGDCPVVPAAGLSEPDMDMPPANGIDLRPCRPSLEHFPWADWRRCLTRSLSPGGVEEYGAAAGDPSLREALAGYLRRTRGVTYQPDELIITNGTVHSIYLLARCFLAGRSAVGVEDPGFAMARQALANAGAVPHPCPVDAEGIVTDGLPVLSAVYVTPSHQFPTGVRLSLARRLALLDWARDHGALVLEDDYDGEFRYDVPPLPPLAAMAPEHVVYLGSFSKTMFPGLRLGFAAGHREIITAMARYRAATDYAAANQPQQALARFIAEGAYERHIHRSRRLYARKRKALCALVAERLEGVRVTGISSGIDACLQLPGGQDAGRLSRRLATGGVHLPPMVRYRHGDGPVDNALVAGYGPLSQKEMAAAIDRIGRIMAA